MPQSLSWSPDVLPGFMAATLQFPDDYEGRVIATLIKKPATAPTEKAVLYVHGFIDYFFQAHLAEAYTAHGFDFYALDLRKYGRSWLPHQHPNFCKDVREYFADISAAIEIITEVDGHSFLLLNGHSTGGLTTPLYAHAGQYKDRINALFLNSPFLKFNVSAVMQQAGKVLGAIGQVSPFMALKDTVSPLYPQSLHRDHHGEWAFNLAWKPIEGYPAFFGWLGAIQSAQRQAQAGLNVQCPILLMHSDKSIYGKTWSEAFHTGDAVLNVEHMKSYGPGLGKNVKMIEIKNGLHDLMLSRREAREKALAELFAWLDQISPTG